MKQLLEQLGVLWCRTFHNNRKTNRPNISRPINGKYCCWTCLREYSVDPEKPVPGTYVNGEVVLG